METLPSQKHPHPHPGCPDDAGRGEVFPTPAAGVPWIVMGPIIAPTVRGLRRDRQGAEPTSIWPSSIDNGNGCAGTLNPGIVRKRVTDRHTHQQSYPEH